MRQVLKSVAVRYATARKATAIAIRLFGVRSDGPERLLASRRIHEGMCWGAAASEKIGCKKPR